MSKTKLTKEQIRKLKKGDVVYFDDINRGIETKVIDVISKWQGGGALKFTENKKQGFSFDELYRLGVMADLDSLSLSDKHYC